MTTTTETVTGRQAQRVAMTIHSQIQRGIFWSLGASDMHATVEGEGGLGFTARILPMKRSGGRASAARRMLVQITLNGWDYYDVSVSYLERGQEVTHYSTTNVDCEQLGRLLLALDYDGQEVLNPRYL